MFKENKILFYLYLYTFYVSSVWSHKTTLFSDTTGCEEFSEVQQSSFLDYAKIIFVNPQKFFFPLLDAWFYFNL